MSQAVTTMKEHYAKNVVAALQKDLGLRNVMRVPRIEKVVVNVGTGKILKESGLVDELTDALVRITGQKPVTTQARQSIAGFKTRRGQAVGMKVTLRGARMWDFLDRLVHIALPRVRDFQGIKKSAVDASGNVNIGIEEHIVFPEIVAEEARQQFSFQITVVSTAQNAKDGLALFRAMGFPFSITEQKFTE